LESEELLAYTASSSISHLIDTGENSEDKRKETIVPLDSLTGHHVRGGSMVWFREVLQNAMEWSYSFGVTVRGEDYIYNKS
jgi:hypothetical protein